MFYVGRVNMGVAIPLLQDEFGYSKTVLGGVLTALFFAYGVGQFVNGQLGDKLGGRIMIAAGLILSAAFNLLFGFSTILTVMIAIWAVNGYVQSMGWSPSVKTIANWFPRRIRGRISGVLGTSYQVGAAVSIILAGLMANNFGWQWVFWLPAILLVIAGIHWYVRGRNAPEVVGLPTIEEEEQGKEREEACQDHHLGFSHTLRTVLTSRPIWIVAFGLFFLNIIRYGFMDWAPAYLFEEEGANISTAAFKTGLMPIAGVTGALLTGWLSDKVFKERRAPAAAIMLLFLALFTWVFIQTTGAHWVVGLLVLLAIGFFTYGPHVAMVTACPMDFGTRKVAASAAGFIDGVGYMGAALTGVVSGYLVDNYGWNYAFYLWLGGAIAAAALMLILWNYRPKAREYL
jgi:OPA family glycerol-3-phosphate transporter-like MFS transporter